MKLEFKFSSPVNLYLTKIIGGKTLVTAFGGAQCCFMIREGLLANQLIKGTVELGLFPFNIRFLDPTFALIDVYLES